MSKSDVEIALANLKEITVELRFLYENKESRSISHTTNDLFGEHTKHVILSSSPHYLHFKVMGVRYGSLKNDRELTPFQLKYILDSSKEQIALTCNSKATKSLKIAYLKRIELLNDMVLKYQKINVVTENYDALEEAGYSPEHIEYKEKEYSQAALMEIRTILIEPLRLWLTGLIESINLATSSREARKVLAEFTKIEPSKEERSSRAITHYELDKDKKSIYLPLLHERLRDVKFISDDTPLQDFINIFKEPVVNKISWTGGIGALIWFIEAIEEERVVIPVSAKNLTASNIFEIKDKDVYESLKGGKSTKPSQLKNSVAEVLSLFKRYSDQNSGLKQLTSF